MTYVTGPYVSKARGDAVRLVRLRGWSQSKTARHVGVNRSTVSRWVKIAPTDLRSNISTKSSRPKNNPNKLSREIINKIIETRLTHNRCACVLHQELANQGVKVSLSSVKRTLKRFHLIKTRSKWARYRKSTPRPIVYSPGDLVQADTIHYVDPDTNERFYVYTVIDIYTRKAFAMYSKKINTHNSLLFIKKTGKYFGFKIKVLQTDNGPEFGKWFNDELKYRKITLRHSRVRKPNDNAHIERFNRTIQEEAIGGLYTPRGLKGKIKNYLDYYNNDRLHLSIGLITPNQRLKMLQRS